jgi:hypothetical protein
LRLNKALAYSLILCLPLVIQGCTAIGLVAGDMIDERSGNKGYLETGSIKPGDKRLFSMRDGTVIKGTFIGMDTLDDKEYEIIQMNLQDSLIHYLATPLIGDTLIGLDTVVIEKFIYEYSHQALRPADFIESQYISIVSRSIRDGRPLKFCMGDIAKLPLSDGKTIYRRDLMNLLYAGRLPLKSRVIIESNGAKMSLDLNYLEKTSRVKTRKGVVIGGMAGMLIDLSIVALVAAIIVAMQGFSPGGF